MSSEAAGKQATNKGTTKAGSPERKGTAKAAANAEHKVPQIKKANPQQRPGGNLGRGTNAAKTTRGGTNDEKRTKGGTNNTNKMTRNGTNTKAAANTERRLGTNEGTQFKTKPHEKTIITTGKHHEMKVKHKASTDDETGNDAAEDEKLPDGEGALKIIITGPHPDMVQEGPVASPMNKTGGVANRGTTIGDPTKPTSVRKKTGRGLSSLFSDSDLQDLIRGPTTRLSVGSQSNIDMKVTPAPQKNVVARGKAKGPAGTRNARGGGTQQRRGTNNRGNTKQQRVGPNDINKGTKPMVASPGLSTDMDDFDEEKFGCTLSKALTKLINEAITAERNIGYTYLAMACCFGHPSKSLLGFTRYFTALSNQCEMRAVSLSDYLSGQKGKVTFKDIVSLEEDRWESPKKALKDAIKLETTKEDYYNQIIQTANEDEEKELSDFISRYLNLTTKNIESLQQWEEKTQKLKNSSAGIMIVDLQLRTQTKPTNAAAEK